MCYMLDLVFMLLLCVLWNPCPVLGDLGRPGVRTFMRGRSALVDLFPQILQILEAEDKKQGLVDKISAIACSIMHFHSRNISIPRITELYTFNASKLH